MGMLLSLGLLALLRWTLGHAQTVCGVLLVVALALFLVRRHAAARVTAYALGGIGMSGLCLTTAVLWTGQELGVF
ncbi:MULTISPECIES: hypothetical protein [Streptomyces]|uniref:hypothetical protein n=1 Tax=Streptomyces TaxID=1883 RepID=UPI000ABFBC68